MSIDFLGRLGDFLEEGLGDFDFRFSPSRCFCLELDFEEDEDLVREDNDLEL